jgi:hypothetical protein
MKTRILSALAVLACVTALSACASGKHASPADTGTGPAAAAVTTQPAAPGAPRPSGSSAGSVAGSVVSENPDTGLSSIDQQLSDLDSALGSAAQSPSDDG